MDPDDLNEIDLASTKADAKPVLDEYLLYLESLEAGSPDRDKALTDFGRHLAEWDAAWPATAGDRKTQVMAALNMDAGQYRVWVEGSKNQKAKGEGFTPDDQYPDQPAPPGKAPEGDDKRPVITNCKAEKYTYQDEEGNEKEGVKYAMLPIDSVRNQVHQALNGYPFRLGAPGEQHPVLFMPDGLGGVRRIRSSKAFETVALEYSTLKFSPRRVDLAGKNFAGWDNLFHSFSGSREIRSYSGISLRPHEPLLPDLFYTWRGDPSYTPDLRYLLEALDLFYNIRHPWQKAVFLASICTPYAGLPRATRPIFCFCADAPGKGKGRASELVGLPAGGMIEIEAGRKGEEQLKERVLSGEGADKWCLRLDNLKDGLNSPVVESVVTLPEISGKQMYKGEAARPNYFTMLVTANNVRVSPDIGRRSFFIELDDPTPASEWEARYQELLRCSDRLIADCLSILRTPLPEADLKGSGETFFLWAHHVLGRVAAHPLLRERLGLGDLDLRQILELNAAIRQDVDEDRDQAFKLEDHLVRLTAVRRGYAKLTKERMPDGDKVILTGREERVVNEPKPDEKVRVTADEVFAAWKQVFGGKSGKAPVCRRIVSLIKAKRFRWLAQAPRASSGNQYELPGNAFTEFLRNFKDGKEDLPNAGYEEQEGNEDRD